MKQINLSMIATFGVLLLFSACSPKFTSEILTVSSNTKQIKEKPFSGDLKSLEEAKMDTSQVVLIEKKIIQLVNIPRYSIGTISFLYNSNLNDAMQNTLASLLKESKEQGASFYSISWKRNSVVVLGEFKSYAMKPE